MKAIFFLLVLFLATSVFALSPYTMPGQKPDLNTGKYGKGQATTPLAYTTSPEIQPLNSINSVFPSLNNIDFATDGNLSLETDYANSKITLKVLPIAFSKADVNNAQYFGGQLPGFYLDYNNLLNAPNLSVYSVYADSNNDGRLSSGVISNPPWITSYIDTNAQTVCKDANLVLAGDGNCVYYNVGQTYFPDKILTIKGTDFNNNDINAIKYYDENYYTVREEGGANPLTIDVNFSGVTKFDSFLMREKYSGIAGHVILVEIYDFVSNKWEEYNNITDQIDYETINTPVPDQSDHIKNGVVSMRFYHIQNGNINHYFYLDYLWLVKGTTTAVNFTHDSLSDRNSFSNHPWAVPYQNAYSDLNFQQKNILAKDLNLYRSGKITFFDNLDINKFNISDFNHGEMSSSAVGNAIDSSANAVNATMVGTVAAQTGKIEGARGAYTVSTDYFTENTGATTFDDGQSVSICFWAKCTNTTVSARKIFSGSGDSSGKIRMMFFMDNATQINFDFGKWGVGDWFASKAITLTENSWYWICGTYNGADNKVNIYVNNSVGTEATFGGGASTASTAWGIGGDLDGASAISNFYLDDFRVYQSVLSASDMNSIYNSGNGTEATVGTAFRWYKMNEGGSVVLPSIMVGLQTDGALRAKTLLTGSAVPNNMGSGDLNVSGKSYFTDDANFFKNVKITGTLIGGSPVKIEGGLNVLSGVIQAKEIKSSVIYSTDSIYYKTITPKPLCIMADNNAVVGCLPEFRNGIYSFVCAIRPECDSKTKELELLDKEWATVKSKFKDDKNKE